MGSVSSRRCLFCSLSMCRRGTSQRSIEGRVELLQDTQLDQPGTRVGVVHPQVGLPASRPGTVDIVLPVVDEGYLRPRQSQRVCDGRIPPS